MANPYTGEVDLIVDGQRRRLKLTLGALAELETRMKVDGITDLVARFEGENPRARDVLLLICAGLRGGGWDGDLPDLLAADIDGGVLTAARVAARLLNLAFQTPP